MTAAERVADVPIYFADPLVRRSEPLQQTSDARPPKASANARMLNRLGLTPGAKARVIQKSEAGDASALLEVALDDRLPDGVVRVPAGHAATSTLGAMFGPILDGARLMNDMLGTVTGYGADLFGAAWPVVWTLAKIVAIVVPILLCVAYLTFWERKVIGWMQVRIGPNRVGPLGLLQPIADGIKLILKEVITPTQADKSLFFLAPMLAIMPALAAWAVVPFGPDLVLADVNAGLLYVLAMTSVGVYGVIIAGWASNSKYAFLGALRAAAQMVCYELAMGFALVAVLMVSGTHEPVGSRQRPGHRPDGRTAAGLPVVELAAAVAAVRVYLVSGVAETNRHPFDVAEGESEIVAGHMSSTRG